MCFLLLSIPWWISRCGKKTRPEADCVMTENVREYTACVCDILCKRNGWDTWVYELPPAWILCETHGHIYYSCAVMKRGCEWRLPHTYTALLLIREPKANFCSERGSFLSHCCPIRSVLCVCVLQCMWSWSKRVLGFCYIEAKAVVGVKAAVCEFNRAGRSLV